MSVPPAQTLPWPGSGTLTALVTTDEETGVTRYRLRAPRLRGVMLVRPAALDDELVPAGAVVSFGDGAGRVHSYLPRPDEPVAHGVRVHGRAACRAPQLLPGPAAVLVEAVALGEDHATRRLPDKAAELVEKALLAVLSHWYRTDRDHLALAAGRRAAPAAAESARDALEQIERALTADAHEAEQLRDRIRRLEQLALTTPAPVSPLAEAARLPFTHHDGALLGVLTVRETVIDPPSGSVTYRVDGPRARGSFTLGPRGFGTAIVPDGISVHYGVDDEVAGDPCQDAPVVNGVRVSGRWYADDAPVTPTEPARLAPPSRTAAGRAPVPEATRDRLFAVMRALAIHHLARPDLQSLRLGAARAHARERAAGAREALIALAARTRTRREAAERLRERLAQARELERPGGASPLQCSSRPNEAFVERI